MKQFLLCLLSCLLTTGLFSQETEKDYTEAFDMLEVWLEAQKDFDQLPGISASVVEDQQIIWKGSYGKANPEKEVPSETSTLYSICSISKLFTAVAVMKLYDEGKIRLDDRIDELLPWYDLEQKYPNSGPITVRTLLTHSSGLPREANSPYWSAPDFSFPKQEEVREGLAEQETLYPSSTYFQYSNLGLTLLGELVEEISGIPYQQYVAENILEPLRLSATRTNLPKDLYGDQLAVGYSALDRRGEREKLNLFQANGITAAAGFSSNVEDLANFASWQFRLLDTTSTEILRSATLKNMHNVHWMDPDWETSWGLGFAVFKGPDGKKWVSHGGSCPGYRSVIQLNPSEKRAYVVMINANGSNPEKYARGIHDLLAKVNSEKLQKEDENVVDFKDYEGIYDAQPWSSEVYVGSWEGKLALLPLPTESPAERMNMYKHVEGDIFRRVRDDGELGETLTFERDEEGTVYRFESHGNFTVKKAAD